MTISVDMTLLAVLALIVGIAAFFAPRFLGIAVAAGLCVFGVLQLFPEVRNELGGALSAIDLDRGVRVEERAPADGVTRNPD